MAVNETLPKQLFASVFFKLNFRLPVHINNNSLPVANGYGSVKFIYPVKTIFFPVHFFL
jgi:hypothetical protein